MTERSVATVFVTVVFAELGRLMRFKYDCCGFLFDGVAKQVMRCFWLFTDVHMINI